MGNGQASKPSPGMEEVGAEKWAGPSRFVPQTHLPPSPWPALWAASVAPSPTLPWLPGEFGSQPRGWGISPAPSRLGTDLSSP